MLDLKSKFSPGWGSCCSESKIAYKITPQIARYPRPRGDSTNVR